MIKCCNWSCSINEMPVVSATHFCQGMCSLKTVDDDLHDTYKFFFSPCSFENEFRDTFISWSWREKLKRIHLVNISDLFWCYTPWWLRLYNAMLYGWVYLTIKTVHVQHHVSLLPIGRPLQQRQRVGPSSLRDGAWTELHLLISLNESVLQ